MSQVGMKLGTKNWSEASPNTITKSDGLKNLGANELTKLGGDNIGEVLNRVADPNWIDPSKKARAVGSDKLDKDAFMKLMMAQLKNQDPTNPLKSHEMAAQLAQFSSLEQLQNVNTSLDDMKAQAKPTETYQSLNFIGKAVSGDASKVSRLKGDKYHDFSFTLPEKATTATIQVKNENGEVVRKVELRDLKPGANSWTWNGQNDHGQVQTVGEYRFDIDAKNEFDKKMDIKTDFEGIISGVNYTPEGPVLLIGNMSVKLSDVRQIVDPSMIQSKSQKDQNSKNVEAGLLKNADGVKQNNNQEIVQTDDVQGAPDKDEKPVGNVMGLPMSREFQAKLEAETKLSK
ncbi:MAG: flagellar hook assembly protein FlgD [Bdellovibrionaceae bacterium]|nr:flagellar hook assembly protein FlgD [Pseudobdellovibrionaceae bacterium]